MESTLTAEQFDCLQQVLQREGWQLTATDGGQNNFVGWEAHLRFEREGAVLTLIQGERAGQAYYDYEANPKALMQLQPLVAQCPP
ncbi:hypothetical protein [Sulfurivirga sp.]|uniref:hypothetical protein n=1 Tax=Sulfurivirga sp. TaxID=2614236 RepID=UPI0025F868A2|nr:hypothetical protein [Sulfurivirga sp.]